MKYFETNLVLEKKHEGVVKLIFSGSTIVTADNGNTYILFKEDNEQAAIKLLSYVAAKINVPALGMHDVENDVFTSTLPDLYEVDKGNFAYLQDMIKQVAKSPTMRSKLVSRALHSLPKKNVRFSKYDYEKLMFTESEFYIALWPIKNAQDTVLFYQKINNFINFTKFEFAYLQTLVSEVLKMNEEQNRWWRLPTIVRTFNKQIN